MAIRNDYEVSSEGAVRHWEFTKTRLEETSPTATQPFAVLSGVNGVQLTGTVLTSVSGDTQIVGDVTPSMVYKHFVRNVIGYAAGAESVFAAVVEGAPIYYDRSSVMPADTYLSLSPLDENGDANPLFGHAVLEHDSDTFPKGTTTASTQEVAVSQVGAGAAGNGGGSGFIPLDITSLREIASNDIQNLAAHGGILASDSDPSLARVNGATDKALRVIWDTAADTDEVAFPPVPKPPGLNASGNIVVHLLMAMGGATDTPTVDVQVFDGLGDTEMGGATAAVAGTTITEYTVTIAAANIGAYPGFINIALVPGVHENDALHLYGAWLTYQTA